MSLDDIYLNADDQMETAIASLVKRIKAVRTGRASAAMLDHVKVDYYGEMTPLIQLANISAPEARLLVIKPFDPSSLDAICKGIIACDLGINPQSDGKVVRMAIPAMTEETRRKQSGVVREEGEKAKLTVRNIRRDANKAVDDEKKEGSAPEDACFKMKDDIQTLTKDTEKKIDETVATKSAEIMEI